MRLPLSFAAPLPGCIRTGAVAQALLLRRTCTYGAGGSETDSAIDATGHKAIREQLKGNERAEPKPLPRRPFLCTPRTRKICVSLLFPAGMSLGKMARSRWQTYARNE